MTAEMLNRKLKDSLDLKDLNKTIKKQYYKLPVEEESFSKMSGAKYFSKPDARNECWQNGIDKKSSRWLSDSHTISTVLEKDFKLISRR